ncbi:hypothetical protein [Fulvimonas yonginensis]|uniref:Uncharacterized protein n=1 Tax=Fulvimonas yonginensis TaxID=1495200 RepID=A0ABU8JEQ8_9GAMM
MFGFLKRFSMVGGGNGNGNAAVEAEARTVLGSARLFPRACDPDDGPRVVVWLGPRQNFIYSPEEAERRIGRLWPELDLKQVQRMLRYLGARVQAAIEPERVTERRSWVRDWATPREKE